jgi:transposase
MGFGISTIGKQVRQLREERNDISPQTTTMTSEQRTIRELKTRRRRMEVEKEILKIPTGHYEAIALLMSGSLNNSH